MRPAVSVLIPVFDGASTLADALASVAAQTPDAPPFEALVVLNGCRDASEPIARGFAARDPRFRIETLPRADLVAALNHGLERARAPLVARLDADDRMLPERLAHQAAALTAHPDWTLCTTGVQHDGPPGGMAAYVEWLNDLTTPAAIRAARFVDAPVAHPAVMFRRRAVLDAGGYRAGVFPEDHELWLRLLERGAVFGRVDAALTIWRDRPERLTRTHPNYAADACRDLRQRYLLSGPLAGGRHARIWGAGRYGKRHTRELLARGAAIDDLIDIDPRKIGGRIAGCPVVSGAEVDPPDGRLVLLCVATRGARAIVANRLEAAGHRPERDYLALQ